MTERKAHGYHDDDKKIAFQGHEGKHAPFPFHGKNPAKIPVHNAQKSKVVNHHAGGKPDGKRRKGRALSFNP